MNNILEFIQSYPSLNAYYEEILRICSLNNYELQLRYKIEGDVANLGFFDPSSGVIGVEYDLSDEDKASCISHELAHVELMFNNELEIKLQNLSEYLNDLIEKIYLDKHLTLQIINTIHHCLIDRMLIKKGLSNHLFHMEIGRVNSKNELTVIHDDFLELDEEGFSIEVPVEISRLNNPENIQEKLMPFQRLLNQLILIEKTLNGNSNDRPSKVNQDLFQIFYEFKNGIKTIDELINYLYFFLSIDFNGNGVSHV